MTSVAQFDRISARMPSRFCQPLLPALVPMAAAAQAMRDRGGEPEELEELTIRLAGGALAALNDSAGTGRAPTSRDERRVAAALRWIEAHADGRLSIDTLAAEAAVSAFHFLRLFDQVVGVTPHQYVLRRRLCRAAVRLCGSNEPIATVALESGFDDLSTFNRQFRRTFGLTPGVYRARAERG